MDKWFMGKCSSTECTLDPKALHSVCYLELVDNFLCWKDYNLALEEFTAIFEELEPSSEGR